MARFGSSNSRIPKWLLMSALAVLALVTVAACYVALTGYNVWLTK